ncbi:hypothetical protein GCM10023350_30650 [Nocardioides endophyticus]|uniref:Uncharacterized protein n=1 Tax=Nocardioides endophyticus TaxID=1353775 RepID=A0ABP8Z1H9_9ACTN
MTAEIDKATNWVHVEFYITAWDDVTGSFYEALARADGIATPVVALALAAVATETGAAGNGESGGALQQLAIGLLVGLVVGVGSDLLVNLATGRRWVENGGRRIATLAAALCSFALAVTLDGNGFIAAFVAGISFGASLRREVTPVHVTTELPELPRPRDDRLRGAEPHDCAHAAGRARAPGDAADQPDRRLHGLVRSARPRLDRVRSACRRRAG